MCERKEINMSSNSVIYHADRGDHSDCNDQEQNLWEKIASKQKATDMTRLDYLVYNPERLACTEQEKDACLETVRKLVRFCYELRRNGLLVASTLAEEEKDPFFRACLLEFVFDEGYIELEDVPARLERVFAAYLAAGDYRGGAFLNAVLVAKGLLLIWKILDAPPAVQGRLLSVELRGFFGVEYRERVIAAVKEEIRSHTPRRKTSIVPAFDQLAQLSVVQRQWLLQNVDIRALAIALAGAGAAVEDALLEAVEENEREPLAQLRPSTQNLRAIDVETAQQELLNASSLMMEKEHG